MDTKKVDDWMKEIEKIWDSFSTDFLLNYIESMPTRIEQCIERNGGAVDFKQL